MKKIYLPLLCCLLSHMSMAQEKKLQLSVQANPVDATAAAEFGLSKSSTLYLGIGFGIGTINAIHLDQYFDKSENHDMNSDVVLPELFFAPYLNLQYRNYFLRARDQRKGYYSGNNSGMYLGARFKAYTAPVFGMNEQVARIRENYMFGLMVGYQKALGAQRRLLINMNTGLSTHANHDLSFFGFKPMLYASVGYIIK